MIDGPTTVWRAGTKRLPSGENLTDWGYAAGWQLVRAMPDGLARNLFDFGARYAARGRPPTVAKEPGTGDRNGPGRGARLAHAGIADVLRAVLAGGFSAAVDEPRRISSTPGRCLSGADKFAAAKQAGRGAVMALPHSGNWDMAGVWLAQHYGTFTTVAERLKPESLYDRFIEFRESLGFEVLPLTGGERPPAEVLAERLRSNQFVCLMADRDLTRSGVPVEFFGEPTRMPAGPAKLAIETGAPLHPAHVYYDGQDCVVQIDDAIDTGSGDVRVIIQALADRFAVNIAAHPRTGTCFSHCGLPTSPTRAGPILRRFGLMGIGPICA